MQAPTPTAINAGRNRSSEGALATGAVTTGAATAGAVTAGAIIAGAATSGVCKVRRGQGLGRTDRARGSGSPATAMTKCLCSQYNSSTMTTRAGGMNAIFAVEP